MTPRLALCLGLLTTSAQAGEYSLQEAVDAYVEDAPRVVEILQAAADQCAREASGELILNDYLSITTTDLDGDQERASNGEIDDYVVDFNYIYCSTGNLWGGSGGAPVHFVVNGTASKSWTGANWKIVRFNDYVPALILLGRHGSACDGYGAQACVQAIAIDNGVFSTVVYAD